MEVFPFSFKIEKVIRTDLACGRILLLVGSFLPKFAIKKKCNLWALFVCRNGGICATVGSLGAGLGGCFGGWCLVPWLGLSVLFWVGIVMIAVREVLVTTVGVLGAALVAVQEVLGATVETVLVTVWHHRRTHAVRWQVFWNEQ